MSSTQWEHQKRREGESGAAIPFGREHHRSSLLPTENEANRLTPLQGLAQGLLHESHQGKGVAPSNNKSCIVPIADDLDRAGVEQL